MGTSRRLHRSQRSSPCRCRTTFCCRTLGRIPDARCRNMENRHGHSPISSPGMKKASQAPRGTADGWDRATRGAGRLRVPRRSRRTTAADRPASASATAAVLTELGKRAAQGHCLLAGDQRRRGWWCVGGRVSHPSATAPCRRRVTSRRASLRTIMHNHGPTADVSRVVRSLDESKPRCLYEILGSRPVDVERARHAEHLRRVATKQSASTMPLRAPYPRLGSFRSVRRRCTTTCSRPT